MNMSTAQTADFRTLLRQHLNEDLGAVNEILAKQLRSSSEFVNDVVTHVARYRGKQIRPILLLLMARTLTGRSADNAKTLAAAMELIHTATLVHDDVIDDSDVRRHVATVHSRWNIETSVLLGDYLFSRAFHLTATTGDAEACRLIGLATDRTCEGELRQSAQRGRVELSELDYFRVIRGKTGELFSVSCLLGARAGNASPEQQRAAARFGMRVGLAFQIADDVLDLTGDTSKTGKQHGNDLENNRVTLPILRAISLADAQQRSKLIRGLTDGGLQNDPASHHPLIAQGIDSAAETATQLAQRAARDLKFFPNGPDRNFLKSIAEYAAVRPQ